MKNTLRKFISFVLLISILVLPNIYAFAEEDEFVSEAENREDQCASTSIDELDSIISEITDTRINVSQIYLDTFAASYFYSLNENLGHNRYGSCSYVAAAMLLSFYDTYWDDNIIEEKYEAVSNRFSYMLSEISSSPGITNEGITPISKVDYYDDFVVPNSDRYFHPHLIRIARENNIYNPLEPLSLFPSGVKNLLEYYLYEERGFDESDVTVEYTSAITNIYDFCVEKVKQGIPVFASMCASDLCAHSIIIYDYNEEEDELYCHYGWEGDTTNHVALSSIKYQYFEGAVTLNFNSEHSHSNNYVDSEGNTYCSCYFSCHPEHVCTYAPCEDDDSKHIYTCNCQYKADNTADHSLMYVSKGASYHIQRCTACGWTSETESHYWQSSDLGDSVECKFCGYLKRLNGGFIPIIKSKKADIKEVFAYAEVE